MLSNRPIRFLSLAAALMLGGLLAASSAHAGKVRKAATVSPFADQIAQLRAARAVLQKADRDYKGHRAAAVKQITEAIKVLRLGTTHRKHPHAKPQGGGEPQDVSDAQLTQAMQQVQAVQKQLAGVNDPRAAKATALLGGAVKQLQAALKIK